MTLVFHEHILDAQVLAQTRQVDQWRHLIARNGSVEFYHLFVRRRQQDYWRLSDCPVPCFRHLDFKMTLDIVIVTNNKMILPWTWCQRPTCNPRPVLEHIS